MGGIFEAPVGLIDRQVELRFHPEDLSKIEIFFQNKSYGMATAVNPHVNSKIGRNWDSHPNKPKKTETLDNQLPLPTGQLFNNRNDLEV